SGWTDQILVCSGSVTSYSYPAYAAVYFQSEGQLFEITQGGSVSVTEAFGSTGTGSYLCCLLVPNCPEQSNTTCQTPSGNVPCYCNPSSAWSATVNQCSATVSLCH